jgi:hypothetical protein
MKSKQIRHSSPDSKTFRYSLSIVKADDNLRPELITINKQINRTSVWQINSLRAQVDWGPRSREEQGDIGYNKGAS